MAKHSLSTRHTFLKNAKFMAIGLPLGLTLWMIMVHFPSYFDLFNFESLPQFARIEHITSLFYRKEAWAFPFGLIPNIAHGIPISLTNNIPIFALIYKIFDVNTAQYFGLWIIVSFFLTCFFAYRISKNIFRNNAIGAGLGATLFVYLPFIWYHSMFVPWMAGIWLVLWAYSLYFKKKTDDSKEWYAVFICSCLVHPFFAFVNLGIFFADLYTLYVHYQKITSLKAAKLFGITLTLSVAIFSILGTFYLPTFTDINLKVPPLSLINIKNNGYNVSYMNIGQGVLWGAIFCTALSFYFSRTKTYLNYYRSLVFYVLILTVYGTMGGIQFSKNFLFYLNIGQWFDMYFRTFFTSGPKYLLPILFLFPIIIVHTCYLIEKKRKYLGIFALSIFTFLQVASFPALQSAPNIKLAPLDAKTMQFIQDHNRFNWLYNKDIPYKPDAYESLAYYAFQHNTTINMVPIVRMPSGYKNDLYQEYKNFNAGNYRAKTLYILSAEIYNTHTNLTNHGTIMPYENMYLFSPKKTSPKE